MTFTRNEGLLSRGLRRFVSLARPLARFDLPAGLLAAGLLLAACDEPKQDDFVSEGGISPTPVGVITGAVAYLGPKPECEYTSGKATRVVGRVVMTMFEYNNPAPPEGRATSALNLFYINGSKLFTLEDCRPDGAAADYANPITRSVDYRWPGVPLQSVPMVYQIRGFYDADEDMNPFFRVRNLPTGGDLGGGAVENILDPYTKFLQIHFPALQDAQDGFIRPNITVALNAPVRTERPSFQLSANRYLNAEERVPAVPNIVAVDADTTIITVNVGETIQDTWELSCAKNNGGEDCGLSVDLLTDNADTRKTFAAAGVQVAFTDPIARAFYAEPVDIRTIHEGKADELKADGLPDPHPVLGATTSLGIPWMQPMVLLQRSAFVPNYDPSDQTKRDQLTQAQATELAAKIPGVALVGTPLFDEVAFPPVMPVNGDDLQMLPGVGRTFSDSMNIAVPPVGVVDPSAASPACRIPYLAYGGDGLTEHTTTRSYESRTTECQDLPTGVYSVNVLSGVAGGVLSNAAPPVSSNGKVIDGERYSSQVWSLPNELADTAQVGPGNELPSQGWNSLFVVHDPNPSNKDPCDKSIDPDMGIVERDIVFRQICGANEDPYNPADEDANGVDSVSCLPQFCCDAISHLCDVPLCALIDPEVFGGRKVRASPTKLTGEVGENGQPKPECSPFRMPKLCCPTDPPDLAED